MLRLLLAATFFSLLGIVSGQYASDWNPDADGDNAIGVNDLLALLSVFEETDLDNDGIFDSQDDCVGILDACGVCNGTGVDTDADEICDEIDPCVGSFDACGVCNGPGPYVPVIDEIVYITDSLFVPPLGTWYVFSYAVDTLYTYECPIQGCTDSTAGNFNPTAVIEDGSCAYGPTQCSGASAVTFDGHTYNLVGIGTQCWFKENLRSDNYRNGDAIPGNLNGGQWTSTTVGAQSIYGEGTSAVAEGSADEVMNLNLYGRLYNWYAVNDTRSLCPSGWHVPTDEEWMTLEMALGMTLESAQATGWRGTDQGVQMKATPFDTPPWNGTNTSGFSALHCGNRFGSTGSFHYSPSHSFWWSSSPAGSRAWCHYVTTTSNGVHRSDFPLREGLPVRCLRDSIP